MSPKGSIFGGSRWKFKNRYGDASSMPLKYSQPKYGLNSPSSLGCKGGARDFSPSSPCKSSLSVYVRPCFYHLGEITASELQRRKVFYKHWDEVEGINKAEEPESQRGAAKGYQRQRPPRKPKKESGSTMDKILKDMGTNTQIKEISFKDI